VFLAGIVLTGFAQDALAGKIKLTIHTDYQNGVGGEFNITAHDQAGYDLLAGAMSGGYFTDVSDVPGLADGTSMNSNFGGLLGFQTFCIEYNEYIAHNGVYDAEISSGSIFGGVGGGVDPDNGGPLPKTDPVSIGTAYLYTLFATGALAGYEYEHGNDRAESGVMLQKAIWWLEDEISLTQDQKNQNIFLQAAKTQFGSYAAAKADNDFSQYHVAALNLTSNGKANQDQLIMLRVPDAGSTALFLGVAVTALARLRRRH
jgi:hypothetical protein